MTSEPASIYLKEICRLVMEVEVSDGDGNRLELDEGTHLAMERLLAVEPTGNKVMLVGNGGSVAIVNHMHNDLCKAVGIRAMVFYDLPLLTAIVNDDGYERVFERPLELWAEPKDVLVAVSSSGRSENILRAARAVKARGGGLVTLSGFDPGNPLRGMGDLNFYVRSHDYGYVEGAHTLLSHYMTDRAAAKRNRDPGAER